MVQKGSKMRPQNGSQKGSFPSIDGLGPQIMLFPITRAREGIYKDHRICGPKYRSDSSHGPSPGPFDGPTKGIMVHKDPRMDPEKGPKWVQNR